ncbi:MAG: hypothetical protein IPN14_09275 [Bacteroidetes bacterium]|nr:hypothetical protein [Bacteroidota bacterium]
MTLQRQQTPIIYSPQDFEYLLPQISVEKLDNGIPFYSLTDAIEPVLQLELVFDAGLWFESKMPFHKLWLPCLKVVLRDLLPTKSMIRLNNMGLRSK